MWEPDYDGVKGAEASAVVTQAFRHQRLAPAARLAHAHPLMRETCGASVAAATLDSVAGTLVFCGVGDLSARLVGEGRRPRAAVAPGQGGRRVAADGGGVARVAARLGGGVHSRGLGAGVELTGVEGLLKCDPAVIAAWLVRQYRVHHDVVVVVLKRN